jgi:hypothetical protein
MEDGDSANDRDLRAMQRLAAEVWALDRRILNSGASVGELAWAWGADHRLHSAGCGSGSGTTEARLRLGAGPSRPR